MKTLLSINLGNFGSTGRIMHGISVVSNQKGYLTYEAYPLSPTVQKTGEADIIVCGKTANWISQKLAYLTGYNGCYSWISTVAFLNKIKAINPDIIHLHNLHNSYINLPMLFRYIKKENKRIVWTLHDCWAFTGQCPYFTLAKCDKWKIGCGRCTQTHIYPPSVVDRTSFMWKKKRKWFNGVENMTIVTPSEWLASLVKQSYLSNYPIKVINNGIDLSQFHPCQSKFREQHGLQRKKIVLGVSFNWGIRKGLDVFQFLAQNLNNNYQIVLVGTDDRIDAQISERIIKIHRTHSQEELAQIYSVADVFVNPTREENFPTVNIESLACGTPVITFDTGGSPEIISKETGIVVPCDDMEALLKQILYVCEIKPFSQSDCVNRALCFDSKRNFEKYIAIYEQDDNKEDKTKCLHFPAQL